MSENKSFHECPKFATLLKSSEGFWNTVSEGQHYAVWRPLKRFYHHFLISEVANSRTCVKVIHNTVASSLSPSNIEGKVIEEEVSRCSDKSKNLFDIENGLYVIQEPEYSSVDPRKAIERARSRLGEDKYCLVTNNCEHFVRWALTGTSRSDQVHRTFFNSVKIFISEAVRRSMKIPGWWLGNVGRKQLSSSMDTLTSLFSSGLPHQHFILAFEEYQKPLIRAFGTLRSAEEWKSYVKNTGTILGLGLSLSVDVIAFVVQWVFELKKSIVTWDFIKELFYKFPDLVIENTVNCVVQISVAIPVINIVCGKAAGFLCKLAVRSIRKWWW